MKFEDLQNNARDYVGIESSPINALGDLMTAAVSKYGQNIYRSPDKLAKAMAEFNASEMQIRQVTLMASVDGFSALLEKDRCVQQADLNRYIGNALKETGLNRFMVLTLTSAIAFSLNIVFNYVKTEHREELLKRGKAYAIPISVYESELDAFEKTFTNQGGTPVLSKTQMERLHVLSDIGIPQAKYYLGMCILLNAEANKANPKVGLQYLEEAVEAEYPPAAAALGDFYYSHWSADNWNKAYEYYTGFGSIALTHDRQNNLTTILNHGKYNKKLILSTLIFLGAMLLAVVLAPGAGLFTAHRIFGGLCIASFVALIVIALLHHRVKPYDNYYWLLFGVQIIWFFYILIRIIW